MHGLAWDDARRLHIYARAALCVDRPLAIDRIAERVHYATQQFRPNRHVHDRASALDRVAFLDVAVGAKQHHADIVGLEIQRHAANAAGELDHLARLNVVEAVDASDAVPNRQDRTNLGNLGFFAEIRDLVLENGGDFRWANIHDLRLPFGLVLTTRRTSGSF